VSSHRDRNIDAIRAAMGRARKRMNELEAPFKFPRDCCPSCACGSEWVALSDKLAWMRKLLLDRAAPGDDREALALEFDFGRLNLDKCCRRRKT
jgi:hypothetical protein